MSAPNDRCPCGSGKKYKHCCQRDSAYQSPVDAPPEDIDSHAGAVGKAIDWLSNRHRKGWQVTFERLRDELLTPTEIEKLGQLDDETLSAIHINLVEWVLADGEIQVQGTNRRISDYLTGPSGPKWSAGQRDWLQQLGQRPLRLYSVTDVEPGKQITLCDTLNADALPVVVCERSGSRALEAGMYLGCRIMRVGDHFELSGAAFPFSMLSGPAVADLLRATAEEFGPLLELAQEQSFVLMSSWLQLYVAPATMPTLVDQHSGELIVPITDHYRVLDWDALSRALQGCADVEGDRTSGWARHIDCEDGQTRPIASINLSKKSDQISVFYKTQAHADQGRLWLKSLAAGALLLLTRKITNPQAMMLPGRKPKAGGGGNGPADLSPEVVAQVIEEHIKGYYKNWADEPIPVLNNNTPRQAIASAAGLERVKGLLRSYEASEKKQATLQKRREISYDFLWESLGLSR
ncbi:SEC-C domain-containing protein [Propionivibrio sp.]|uniref:SEC-C domain-containing protein n=1 Tax=Propionivibrio sp. TaxID=2212460 RepID=UPI003BF0D7C1